MERVVATILEGDKVIARDISAWIESPSAGTDSAWHGGFDLAPAKQLDPAKTHTMRLADGRRGTFTVSHRSFHSNGSQRVLIQGTGPFGG